MNHLQMIRQYLNEKRALADIPATGHPFVTISRQAGAGGHLLAHVILTDFLKYTDADLFLGWHVFDRQLCEVVAEDPELQNSMEDLVSEHYHSEFREFVEGLFSGRPYQYLRYRKTFDVVRMLATLGKVIIVGRGAASVTRDMPNGIRIRLVAPLARRVKWMTRKLKIPEGEARRLIGRQDSERRRMVKSFFHRDIDDPQLYDAVWNTEKVDPHEISYSVIEMLKFRVARQEKRRNPA